MCFRSEFFVKEWFTLIMFFTPLSKEFSRLGFYFDGHICASCFYLISVSPPPLRNVSSQKQI